jgi:integrase
MCSAIHFSRYLVHHEILDEPVIVPVKPLYTCKSIFAYEIEEYVKLRINMGASSGSLTSSLRSLDKHLVATQHSSKDLPMDVVVAWLDGRDIKLSTKLGDMSNYTGFAKYLSSLGVRADFPQRPRLNEREEYRPYAFASVFGKEMGSYLSYLSGIGRNIHAIRSALRSLDKYLVSIEYRQLYLPSEIISDWLKTLEVSQPTRTGYTSTAKGFVNYLVTLGIPASSPEHAIRRSEYTPYSFTDLQLAQIFDAADNFAGMERRTHVRYAFPILLRLLYSCGLRIQECLFIKWSDIDFNSSVLTIKNAKNKKERFIPLNASLIQVLQDYRAFVEHHRVCHDYIFESNKNSGNPYRQNTFFVWFMEILDKAGIQNIKPNKHVRGLCPHCIRHTFVLHSFLKNENEYGRFEEFAPFLAAYLGHESPEGTETYLRSHHTVYKQSHQRMNAAIGNLFPEVSFIEE